MSDAEEQAQPQHDVEAQVHAEMQQAEQTQLSDEATQQQHKNEKANNDENNDEDPARKRALTAERLRQASAGLLRADLEDPAFRQDTALSSGLIKPLCFLFICEIAQCCKKKKK